MGPPPGDQRADCQTHHDRGKRERDGESCVIAERQAHPCEHPCLCRRELLGESAGGGCPNTELVQVCRVHREAGKDDDEGEHGQGTHADSGNDEPAPRPESRALPFTVLSLFCWPLLNVHRRTPSLSLPSPCCRWLS